MGTLTITLAGEAFPVIVVYLGLEGHPNLPGHHTNHPFHVGCVGLQTNPIKQADQDIK